MLAQLRRRPSGVPQDIPVRVIIRKDNFPVATKEILLSSKLRLVNVGVVISMDISDQQLSPEQGNFLAYWRKQAGDLIAPRRQDFDVLDVPTLMPHVIIFDILRDPLDFRYRLVGTVQRQMSAGEYTGMKMSEIDGRGPGSGIWSILDTVRVSQEPAYHSIPYVGPKKDFMKLNDLFLPWVDDDMQTSMIIVVSCYLPR
jgi:hypothetical protein